jgi:hypothetical protein
LPVVGRAAIDPDAIEPDAIESDGASVEQIDSN